LPLSTALGGHHARQAKSFIEITNMNTKFFSNSVTQGDTCFIQGLITTASDQEGTAYPVELNGRIVINANCIDGQIYQGCIISMTPEEALYFAEELQRVTETFLLKQQEGEK